MWQRFQNWMMNYNIFIDKIDHDDGITDVESTNFKRQQQLYATRLYIIMFVGENAYLIIPYVSVLLGSFLFSSFLRVDV